MTTDTAAMKLQDVPTWHDRRTKWIEMRPDVHRRELPAQAIFMGAEINDLRAALAAREAVEGEAVAYALFAENGNLRIWFGTKESADNWVKMMAFDPSILTPLYTRPSPVAADMTDEQIDEVIAATWASSFSIKQHLHAVARAILKQVKGRVA